MFKENHTMVAEINPFEYFGMSHMNRFDFLFVNNDINYQIRTFLVYPVMSSLAYFDLYSKKISYFRICDPNDTNEFIFDKCYIFDSHLVALNSDENEIQKVCVIDVTERKIISWILLKFRNIVSLSINTDKTLLAFISEPLNSKSQLSIFSLCDSKLIGKINLKSNLSESK